MTKDLRTFIDLLERTYPDEIVRIKRPVDAKWEISSVIQKLDSKQRRPVVIFENVRGQSMPAIENLFSTRKLLALS